MDAVVTGLDRELVADPLFFDDHEAVVEQVPVPGDEDPMVAPVCDKGALTQNREAAVIKHAHEVKVVQIDRHRGEEAILQAGARDSRCLDVHGNDPQRDGRSMKKMALM